MNTYYINKKPFFFASKAEELSPKAFRNLLVLLHSEIDKPVMQMAMAFILFLGTKKISEEEARKPVRLWRKGYLKFRYHIERRLTIEQLDELRLFSDWVFEDNAFVFNSLRVLKNTFGDKYYGIETFTQMSFWEFINADRCYSAYLQTQEIKYLDELIATIYRPRNPKANPRKANYQGDLREEYNDYTVNLRLKWASKLPNVVKSGIAIFYHQSFSAFAQRYDQTVFKKTAKKTNDSGNMGFVNAFYRLAENLINLEQMGKLKVEMAIYKLHLDIETQQKQANA